MGTLSFHAEPALEKRLRAAARKRKVPLSRFLKESVERSLDNPHQKGRELRGIVSGYSLIQPEDTVLSAWNESDPLIR